MPQTSNGLLVWHSVLAALVFVAAGLGALTDLVPPTVAAAVALVVGAAQAGTAVYVARRGTMPGDISAGA
jgi:heme A synthase